MDYVEHMRFASALLLVFAACGERVPCAATGGAWETCPSTQPACVDGRIVEGGDAPAICEAGCACPDDAPVWDADAGCIAESACGCADDDGDGACD